MTAIRIIRKQFRVHELLRLRQTFRSDPEYQREGGIWTLERQQLFIDSILNGLDVPPLYLHLLRPPAFTETGVWRYAVVDGRQRLEALYRFADDHLPLAEDFRLLEEGLLSEGQLPFSEELPRERLRFASQTLGELQLHGSTLYYRFMDYDLPVSVIETDDETLIEELFFRLNEGVPLTAAEKRLRGALLRELVLPLVREGELFAIARFRSRRRNYEDLLLRLLYLESAKATPEYVPDLRKRQLDDFAGSFRPPFGSTWSEEEEHAARSRLTELIGAVVPTIEVMASIFDENDPLLGTVNNFIVYYLTLHELRRRDKQLPTRSQFENFVLEVNQLRGVSEDELADEQLEALDFVQPIQGSTTGSYLAKRVDLLLRYLDARLNLRPDDQQGGVSQSLEG